MFFWEFYYMDSSKQSRFKNTIRFLESSDGQNMQHDAIKTGPNAGQRAGGAYGILPNSLKDFVNQAKNRNMPVDPRLIDLIGKSHEEVTEILNNNRELDDLASDLGSKVVLNKTEDDEEKAAYAWRTGHNRDFANLPPETYSNNDYVKAYREKSQEFPLRQPAATAAPEIEPEEPGLFGNIKKYLGM